MPSTIHRTSCPCCTNTDFIKPSLSVVDFSVSKQPFSIWLCDICGIKFTQDAPDENAIGAYYKSDSYISHTDTKEGLINKVYHFVRNYTLGTKAALVKNATKLKSGKLLDIGAGTGAFAHKMQQKGWAVTALEPDETARKQALKNYQLKLDNPSLLYQLPNKTFDAITLWHVLEHVHDLKGYWEQFARIISDNGKLIIAVPNYTSYDAKIYQQYWAAYDVPRHLYHFHPQTIARLGDMYGFELTQVKPMLFDAYYVSMLSEQYKYGKSRFFAACWSGFISNLNLMLRPNQCSSQIYILTKKTS